MMQVRLVGTTRFPDFTHKQFSVMAGMDPQTLRRGVAAGKAPQPYKQNPMSGRNGKLLYRRAEVLEWLRVFRGQS
jgi:hypothetical protein